MEDKIIKHIKNTVVNNSLRTFLLKLISSPEVNDKLLCICILIDIKYSLLSEENYLSIFAAAAPASAIEYESVMPSILTNRYREEVTYSTLVTMEKFKTRYSSIATDKVFRRNKGKIDRKKIETEGWNGYKGLVWITPYEKADQIIRKSKDDDDEKYKANNICDFLGLARNYDTVKTVSPREPPYKEFVLIKYSDNFNECVYQPNSSNAAWTYPHTLFICYNNSDGHGRTYNESVKTMGFAKERVHRTSRFYDDGFEATYIGQACADSLTRSGILRQAYVRLNIP